MNILLASLSLASMVQPPAVTGEPVAGSVVAWHYGLSSSGIDGAAMRRTTVEPVSLSDRALSNAVSVSAAGFSSCALLKDGKIAAWGAGGASATPLGVSNVVAVSAAPEHMMALRSDGTVIVWGANSYGQTRVPAGLSNVTAVAAGLDHCLALRKDGTVISWGKSCEVQPRLSNVVAIAATPGWNGLDLALQRDGTVVEWQVGDDQARLVPNLSNVVAVATGPRHRLALQQGGSVVAWGGGFCGETNVPLGLRTVVAIAAGGFEGAGGYSLALKRDGTVVAWGGMGAYPDITPVTAPAGLSNVVAIAAGMRFSLAIVTNDFH